MAKKHKIKVLKPLVPKPDATPQCCVKVDPPWRNSSWRKERYGGEENDYNRCQRNSTVQIDGKYYCRLHAGQVALSILLEEN